VALARLLYHAVSTNRLIARVAFMSVTAALTVSVCARGDELTDAAAQGRAEAEALLSTNASLFGADENGNITVSFPDGSGASVSAAELFNPAHAGGSPPVGETSSVYGDQQAMLGAGADARSRLASELSVQGDAYRIVRQGQERPTPDLSNDPLFERSDAVYNDIAAITAEFSDCTVRSETTPIMTVAHVPEYRTCERINKPSQCTRERDFTVNRTSINHTVLQYRGCFDHNYKRMRVFEPNAAQQVLMARFDNEVTAEYSGLYQGGSLREGHPHDVLSGNYILTPLDLALIQDAGIVEVIPRVSATFSYAAPDHYVEVRQAPTAANGWVMELRMEDLGEGGGTPPCPRGDAQPNRTGWIDLTVELELVTIEVEEIDDPVEQCSEGNDGFCSTTWTCTDSAPRTINGVLIDDRFQPLLDPLWNGDPHSPICHAAEAAYDCGFNEGPMECWVDAQGELRCPVNEGNLTNTCDALETNASCGFIGSRCVGGASPDGGDTCYVVEETWDCGTDVEIPGVDTESSFECAGPVRCAGTECVEPPMTQSEDFARAAAALQAAEFMSMDGECTAPGVCGVFKGDALECKKAVGGTQDCCDVPANVSLADYLKVMNGVRQLTTAAAGGEAALGSWEVLRQPVSNAWSAVRGHFATAANSVTASTAAAATDAVAEAGLSQFQQQAANQATSLAAEVGGSFSEGAANTFAANSALMSAASAVMMAWTYYQAFVALVQIIFECEDSEFMLAGKRELKACSHLGSYCNTEALGLCVEKRESYCCYNSPLARIIQEQAAPQLGLSFGTPETPTCAAIPLERINDLDWSAIDLDEWMAILAESDMLPSAESLTPAALTGAGSPLNFDGTRPDSVQRTLERLEGIDGEDARASAEEQLRGDIPPPN
jgi:conjugal transfer mating pair stabilization protein TraN